MAASQSSKLRAQCSELFLVRLLESRAYPAARRAVLDHELLVRVTLCEGV